MLSKKFQLVVDELKSKRYDSAEKILNSISRERLSNSGEKLYNALTYRLSNSSINSIVPDYNASLVDDKVYSESSLSVAHNNNSVKYSFVTSVFNRFWQLKETLPKNLSILRGFEGVQLVIVDFNGADSSEIEKYIEENFSFDVLEGRLKYYKRKISWQKFHMAEAKNSAVRLSDGDFIFSLDADNYLNVSDVNLIIDHFRSYPDSIMHQTTGPAPMQHKMWKNFSKMDTCHEAELAWDGSCGRIASSRKTFEGINGYNEQFKGMGMDDIDFLLRAINNGASYHHFSISRHANDIFIDNGSTDSEHVHSDNQINWDIMNENLSNRVLYADYEQASLKNSFDIFQPACVKSSKNTQVTLFSSVFNASDYIERFTLDLSDIISDNLSVSVWVMDIVGSHDDSISSRLKELSKKYFQVFYIPVYQDPGLYACWNAAIKNIESIYISNLNVDDIRGKGWLKNCVELLDANLCDVSSPITVPFDDEEIVSYDQFWSMEDATKITSTWFDTKVEFDLASKSSKHSLLPAGYYTHENLFQYVDNKLNSYCIPNASAVWKRSIHKTAGYFEEDIYGSYTDLALWMKASYSGAVFKQNSHRALFYLSPNQAHMRQKSEHIQLLSLASKYGCSNYRALSALQAFDLSLNDGSYGDHHLLGWNWVRDNVLAHFMHNPDGILLDMFIERTFFWWNKDHEKKYEYTKPWVGMVHTTPHKSKTFSHDAQNLDCLLAEPRFQRSLKHCLGLIVLSQENADYLNKWLSGNGYHVPVYTMFHPNIPVEQTLDSNVDIIGKVFHVGWHLRSFSSFANLNVPKEKKVLLIPNKLDKEYFINEVVNKELSENGLLSIDNYVDDMYSAPDDLYQLILNEGIIFNHYLQPAGSNLISEAISAKSNLILNRHPAFEEYLGHDYPLFYSVQSEADKLIEKIKSDPKFSENISEHFDKLQPKFSMNTFNIYLSEITKMILQKGLK